MVAAPGSIAGRGVSTRPRRSGYVVVAPGLEEIVAAEMRGIGIVPLESAPGGVSFSGTDEHLFAANLHLRTASRVLVRVALFEATAFHELERLCGGVPWERYVAAGGAVRLRVTCHKSKLYHSDGVAQRVARAIAKRVKGVAVAAPAREPADDANESSEEQPAQLFVVRFDHDQCTISADSSGELLHRRGYRQATAKAPIRETLAAASLLALGWDGATPLVDPMCGAGTIAIEAALLARRIAPGLARSFACERWPGVNTAAFAKLRDRARETVLPAAPTPIMASDRDAGAITAAQANAGRAGVSDDIVIAKYALSAAFAPSAGGLLLTNPPYGARVGDRKELRSLYAQLGNVARAKFPGWTLALLSADRSLDAQVKLPLIEALRFRNGGIPVRLVRAIVG